TDATIVKTLEELGIGRPSTYAPIISVLLDRYYVVRKSRQLIPTILGKIINDLLTRSFPELLDPNFKDALLGLGAYNYYVEEYGGIYKPLRFLIRLPAGDRRRGIQQLEEASQVDGFISTEAKFFLVSIYLRDSQKRYADAERMLHDLTEKYPNNPIFRFALGHAQIMQHQYDSARENFKKVAAHRETPGLGDLAIQVKKELESLNTKGSSLGRAMGEVSADSR
ncbi:MAG: DUF3808 domain-containing protein, partial [Acidobacteriia bacterium]|nr:DUF3808 domain-containing protein [Terriglobia bacterium]